MSFSLIHSFLPGIKVKASKAPFMHGMVVVAYQVVEPNVCGEAGHAKHETLL
jgi:hypothetical protein